MIGFQSCSHNFPSVRVSKNIKHSFLFSSGGENFFLHSDLVELLHTRIIGACEVYLCVVLAREPQLQIHSQAFLVSFCHL